MAILNAGTRKFWSGIAGTWFNKAADKYPHNGRLRHLLGVVTESNIVQQLFHYSKALVSVTPYSNTWPSLMTLFELFPEGSELSEHPGMPTTKIVTELDALLKCTAKVYLRNYTN
jgi:Est1 DNA/RNA binding domain